MPCLNRAIYCIGVLLVVLGAHCKPSLRDPNWAPKPTQKMLEWFSALKYQGHKGTKPYKLEFPEWFVARFIPDYNLTHEAVELGRFLFYDKSLSSDGTISCASCHQQKIHFSDNRRFSIGVKGRQGHRNSMPLVNLVLDTRFFWDGRADSLETQIRSPIQGEKEMDLPLAELVQRLEKHPVYPALFERAYATRQISEERIINALAQFTTSIISYSMPEDYFRAVQDGRLKMSDLPPEVSALTELFKATDRSSNCGPCHQEALARGQNRFENINSGSGDDPGLFVATKREADRGKFKVLALRNIALTGPYMHDGSVEKLSDALTHYRSGRFSSNIPTKVYRDQYGNPLTDALTKKTVDLYEKAYRVNIDTRVLTDPRYSDPF